MIFTFLEYHLVNAADCSGAHVLNVSKKEFRPYGVTVLVLLSESHLSIHTYPEQNFAAIDCYTCGTTVEPQIAIDYIVNILKPERMHIKKINSWYRRNCYCRLIITLTHPKKRRIVKYHQWDEHSTDGTGTYIK